MGYGLDAVLIGNILRGANFLIGAGGGYDIRSIHSSDPGSGSAHAGVDSVDGIETPFVGVVKQSCLTGDVLTVACSV